MADEDAPTDDDGDELIPLSDEEILLVAPEFARRAGLLLRIYQADLIRAPRNDDEAELVAEVRRLFDR